jgi:hypothetical protein
MTVELHLLPAMPVLRAQGEARAVQRGRGPSAAVADRPQAGTGAADDGDSDVVALYTD